MGTPPYAFHGGCLGCTMQKANGIGYCAGCRWCRDDDALPDLNNLTISRESERKRMVDLAVKTAKTKDGQEESNAMAPTAEVVLDEAGHSVVGNKTLAVSIRQPWAWLIVHGWKDVENRGWRVPKHAVGKRVAVHASKFFIQTEIDHIFAQLIRDGLIHPSNVPCMDELKGLTGGIVGSCVFTACVSNSNSPWAMPGQYHWLVEEARPEPFRPMKGRLGFFEVSTDGGRHERTSNDAGS